MASPARHRDRAGKIQLLAVQAWGAAHKPADSRYERGTSGGHVKTILVSRNYVKRFGQREFTLYNPFQTTVYGMSMVELPIITSLWRGGKLSFLEQVCLKSFADFGHRTILYTYEPVENCPPGVEQMEANRIFSISGFAADTKTVRPMIREDVFRYSLLSVQNVIWVDANMLCLRPWNFTDQWVFGWEKAATRENVAMSMTMDDSIKRCSGSSKSRAGRFASAPWAYGPAFRWSGLSRLRRTSDGRPISHASGPARTVRLHWPW